MKVQGRRSSSYWVMLLTYVFLIIIIIRIIEFCITIQMMHIKLEEHIDKMVPINLLTTTFQKIKIQIFSLHFNCAYFDEYEIGCSIV